MHPDDAVIRTHDELTPAALTGLLRAAGWIGDAVVVSAPSETIGPGLMGVCARYRLAYDRDVAGAPSSVIGKFAAPDDGVRAFMGSTGYRAELCFYQHFATGVTIRTPRCAFAAIDDEGWFTLLLEDCAPMEAGDQLRGCTVDQVEAAVAELVGLHAPRWDDPGLPAHGCFADRGMIEPEVMAAGMAAVVPGFLERYGATFGPAERNFYDRLTRDAVNWFATRPTPRTLVHSDYRPDNLLFSSGAHPHVAAVDWQGFQLGCGLADVSFLIGNALTVEDRHEHEERLVRGYHAALAGAGVRSYTFDQCRDDYARSLLSALTTTIFGAMYGARTERGDRMFELMGARHARQILDLGADRFLDPT